MFWRGNLSDHLESVISHIRQTKLLIVSMTSINNSIRDSYSRNNAIYNFGHIVLQTFIYIFMQVRHLQLLNKLMWFVKSISRKCCLNHKQLGRGWQRNPKVKWDGAFSFISFVSVKEDYSVTFLWSWTGVIICTHYVRTRWDWTRHLPPKGAIIDSEWILYNFVNLLCVCGLKLQETGKIMAGKNISLGISVVW